VRAPAFPFHSYILAPSFFGTTNNTMTLTTSPTTNR
jgi:hypothetical protein